MPWDLSVVPDYSMSLSLSIVLSVVYRCYFLVPQDRLWYLIPVCACHSQLFCTPCNTGVVCNTWLKYRMASPLTKQLTMTWTYYNQVSQTNPASPEDRDTKTLTKQLNMTRTRACSNQVSQTHPVVPEVRDAQPQIKELTMTMTYYN